MYSLSSQGDARSEFTGRCTLCVTIQYLRSYQRHPMGKFTGRCTYSLSSQGCIYSLSLHGDVLSVLQYSTYARPSAIQWAHRAQEYGLQLYGWMDRHFKPSYGQHLTKLGKYTYMDSVDFVASSACCCCWIHVKGERE